MKFKLVENFIDDNFSKWDIIEYLSETVDISDIENYVRNEYDENKLREILIQVYPNAIDDIKAENYDELVDDYLSNIHFEDDSELLNYFKELYNDELENELNGIINDGRPEYDADGNRIW